MVVWEIGRRGRTWIRTLTSTVMCSEETRMGFESLTGTIWCFVIS